MDDRTVEDCIREEAYCIYLTRKKYGIPGDDKTDWIESQDKIRRAMVRDAEDLISKDVRRKIEGGY